MTSEQEQIEALEEEITELSEKILDFMQKECKDNSHSAGACYIAMRMFINAWIKAIGPELVKKLEDNFQLIPANTKIGSC